jgi:probable HAF family extracellular repeat protein
MKFLCHVAVLFAVVSGALLDPSTAYAQKKGGGSGTTPPPVTYMLQWLPVGTRIHDLNEQVDFVGAFDDGVAESPLLCLQGNTYDVDQLVNNPDWHIINAEALSNRKGGVLFVVGYGYYQGVRARRAYRLKLAIDPDGLPPTVVEIRDLGVLPGDRNSTATAVNTTGTVVGTSAATGEFAEAFIYSDAVGMVGIDSDLRLESLTKVKLSESGIVAYTVNDADTGNVSAYRLDSSTNASATTLLGKYGSLYGLNDVGNFCGYTTDRTGLKRIGYASFNGALTNLSSMTDAVDISNRNDVLGQNTKYQKGYLYVASEKKTYDIDQLLDTANSAEDLLLWSVYESLSPQKLTDTGIIGGQSYLPDSNTTRAFLLVPVLP